MPINVMKLLCLSNGHGEDGVAIEILKQLQQQANVVEIAALPLVGEGYAYERRKIPVIGPVKQLPSGGFIYLDGGQQLWRDLQGGLLGLTLAQLRIVRQWGKSGVILAVGDIVPLLFAWLSGADYAFVGTAKSEYYLRDEVGWLPQTARIERWLGSVYHPWERWLMSDHRCRAVFPRDSLTAQVLQKRGIPAFDLGNPMMDGLSLVATGGTGGRGEKDLLTILLLPGSRMPEALNNWQLILEAVEGIVAAFNIPLLFLGAIAPALNLAPFQERLIARSWTQSFAATALEDPLARAFTKDNATLVLTQNAYPECLQSASVAIAMAGTATEQFVGLGKAAIAIPGQGPQFTPAFAQAQSRLLGPSLILAERPAQVAQRLQTLLDDSARQQLVAENGRRRLGSPGAAARIARCLEKKLFK